MAGLSVSAWNLSGFCAVVSEDWLRSGMKSKGLGGADEQPPSTRQVLKPKLPTIPCHRDRLGVCECVLVSIIMSPVCHKVVKRWWARMIAIWRAGRVGDCALQSVAPYLRC